MIGCRLISLGMALLTHLPESSVASHRQYEAGVYMPNLGDKLAEETEAKKALVEEQNISNVLIDLENEDAAQVGEIEGLY